MTYRGTEHVQKRRFSRLILLICLCATGLRSGRCAAQVSSPETIRLQAFLANPEPRRLGTVLNDARRIRGDEDSLRETRTLLRNTFVTTWIHRDGGRSPLTLAQFSRLNDATAAEPFGQGNVELVPVLVESLPNSWQNQDSAVSCRVPSDAP